MFVHSPSAPADVRHHLPSFKQLVDVGGFVPPPFPSQLLLLHGVAEPIATQGPIFVVQMPSAPWSVEQYPPVDTQPASPEAWQSIAHDAADSKVPQVATEHVYSDFGPPHAYLTCGAHCLLHAGPFMY